MNKLTLLVLVMFFGVFNAQAANQTCLHRVEHKTLIKCETVVIESKITGNVDRVADKLKAMGIKSPTELLLSAHASGSVTISKQVRHDQIFPPLNNTQRTVLTYTPIDGFAINLVTGSGLDVALAVYMGIIIITAVGSSIFGKNITSRLAALGILAGILTGSLTGELAGLVAGLVAGGVAGLFAPIFVGGFADIFESGFSEGLISGAIGGFAGIFAGMTAGQLTGEFGLFHPTTLDWFMFCDQMILLETTIAAIRLKSTRTPQISTL